MAGPADVPGEIVARLRSLCLRLPQAYEEPAWVGVRWRVRQRTFAHVLAVEGGWPPAYARALAPTPADVPVSLVTFRAPVPEADALGSSGPPFFRPQWGPDVVGMVFDDDVDWTEVAELLTESYCMMAPKKLAGQVVRPGD